MQLAVGFLDDVLGWTSVHGIARSGPQTKTAFVDSLVLRNLPKRPKSS